MLYAATKKTGEAEQCYLKAISINPAHTRAYTNLGILLENTKRFDDAEKCQRIALKFSPDSAEIHSNLAGLLTSRYSSSAEAETHFLRTIELDPASAFSYSNYGVYLANQNRDTEAEFQFRKALSLDPDYQLAHLNLGFLLLAHGRFTEGWMHHESRYSPGLPDSGILLPNPPFPKWQGESLEGKSLLVWLEQGFGDEIQFCRFLPLLKKKCGVKTVTYVCKPQLKRLMLMLEGVDTIIASDELDADVEIHDYWTFPLSFPRYWTDDPEGFPARIPYLKAPADRIAYWKTLLLPNGFKVGLVWRGNVKHHNDNYRSLPGLSTLAPLWSVPGIRFISLQRGSGEDEAVCPPKDQPIQHLGSKLTDFSDTAVVIDQLDLLICVDTATAHLAGALGKPCWVLLPAYRTDWRWLRDRSDSPWYPGNMRLFRQQSINNWAPVVEEVRQALDDQVVHNPVEFNHQTQSLRGDL
jgi:hypothetical protein